MPVVMSVERGPLASILDRHKTVFLGNRRWLRHNHRWRAARAAFNGRTNHVAAPPRQLGLTVKQRGAWRESFLQLGGRANSKHDPVKKTGVKRVSIFFDLPYWEVHTFPMYFTIVVSLKAKFMFCKIASECRLIRTHLCTEPSDPAYLRCNALRKKHM